MLLYEYSGLDSIQKWICMCVYTWNVKVKKLSKESEGFETIKIESKIRPGVFHQVVKDLKSGQAVSCSCKCWTKGNKPCFGMRTVGFEKE